ncbi:MAG: ribosome maturation factor RimM [Aquiluna sp.]|nr:ribosome maturation factor RimM [Aquiluna sp.]
MGRLLKAHGLKGAIKLEIYTDSPEQRFTPGAEIKLQVPEDSSWFGKTIVVKELRMYNSSPVLFIEGIESREDAEGLIRAILIVDQPLNELPQEPEAWFDHQLTGLKVFRDSIEVGFIDRVEHKPAQDLLAITTENGEVLLPFLKIFVPKVDIDSGIVEITPPGGLFEQLETPANED